MEKIPKWHDRYDVLAPEDHDLLETNAAQHEFRGGMSKEDSEAKAHEQYLRNHAISSAAFHYLGMRAAVAANHKTAAKKHGEAYKTAMGSLGYSATDAPPQEILDRAKDESKDESKNPYGFKSHAADGLLASKIPEVPEPTEKEKALKLIEKIKSLRLVSNPQLK